MGLTKKENTSTSREGVNYVRTIVESANCIFHEIHQENDYGNDAFLELVENNNVRGVTLAIQIKSGKSYCSTTECKIPATKNHFEYWRDHSLPVIGIVYDPAEKIAYWYNIKHFLKANPEYVKEGPYTITFTKKEINKVTKSDFIDFFLPIFLKNSIRLEYERAIRFARDPDFDLHSIGIHALMRQYRNNPDTWDLFINLFRNRPIEEIDRYLIYFIAHIPGHPDIFWHKDNILDEDLRNNFKNEIKQLSKDDIKRLFMLMDDDDCFERGSLGQSVEAIISLIDDKMNILPSVASDMTLEPRVRDGAAILFAYYGQEDVLEELKKIARKDMSPGRWAPQLVEQLMKEGYVYLY